MGLITITSDFGTTDHYLGILKGRIYSQLESAKIVDISNNIEKFNIAQPAFILKNSYNFFPNNSIHIVLVGTMHPNMDYVIVKKDSHYFIGLDNGLFSLVFDNQPIFAYRIKLSPPPELFSFPESEIATQAASHLLRGGIPEVIADPIQNLTQALGFAPVIQENLIRASVVHIDSYGNAITNLSKTVFDRIARGREFEIGFRVPKTKADRISQRYSDVEPGEIVILFNSSGFLEIAFNGGRASGLLGIELHDMLTIQFQ